MQFNIDHIDQNARATTITTAHSTIQTPIFMPVGTVGSVKSLDSFDLMSHLDTKIILGNTYHLYLRPNDKIVAEFGGLHEFMKYDRSILTDSGGFQAFSLSDISKAKKEGIEFRSHIDGSKHLFTPQKVLDIQYNLNSDIMMILDDLIALPATQERLNLSIQRTTQWAKESLEYHKSNQQQDRQLNNNIFAIIQGGTDEKYRKLSATQLTGLDASGEGFDGFAIGGLSVGEEAAAMYDTIAVTST